ncbi:MAG TPA: DMT family transporter [Candidatus Limnocylindrales bacterium]|nr:DMT family transporter [Candidatus Limnocylindrales bacterium]
MLAIVGALGAALSWAIATLASSRSSRMIGPPSVIGWVMVVGLAASMLPALLSTSAPIGPRELVELLLIGASYTSGLLLTYAGLAIGRVSIVAPIVATEGAVAAIASVALGEALSPATALVLAVIAAGIVMAAFERSGDESSSAAGDPATQRRTVLLALAAAAAFSVGLVLAGKVGAAGISPAWVIVAGRGTGALAVALPLALRGRLRLARPAVPLVIVAGLLEALGSGLYVIAASVGIATAAVLSSQFAAIAAVAAFVLFGERLQRVQVLGVTLVAIGVTALSAIHG